MEYTIDQILDVPLLQALQDKLSAINPFPSALIDRSGNVLTQTDWQDICLAFHRNHPEAKKECVVSDRYILSHLNEANPAVTYMCPHGLVDNAIPIVIEGHHMASFFTGQFFLESPDIEFFRKQAAKYGFEEKPYLEAVRKVPIWNGEKLHHYLDFIKAFTESLAMMGLMRLREIEANRLAKKVETSLRENELRFASIIENTKAGYFFIDKQGVIRNVNDSWVRLYRYDSREEVVGHHYTEIQQIDDVNLAKDYVERIMDGDPAYLSGDFSRKCKDGSKGYHTFSARPVIIEGEVVGIEGFIIDTTGQKLAELERDLSSKRLESVFGKMIEGFALHEIVCDSSGVPVDYRFLDMNPAFEKLTGNHAIDIIGKTALEVFPGLEQSWIEKYGKVALTGKPETFEMFSSHLGKHYRVVAFSNETGQFATIFDDITERKQAEEKMRTLVQAIDCIKECVSLTDTENQILFVNKAFCNTYGYTSDELMGKNISILRSPAERSNLTSEILSDTLGGGWNGEAINCRKDGTEFPVHISTAMVTTDEDQPVAMIGIAVDITERRRNEQEMIAAKERAEGSDRLKSAFLANISHEIRTPMNSILGFSELLEEMVTDSKQLEYLKIIATGGKRLLNIINSVIDIAKIESGQESLNPAEFDLNELMRELFELNHRRNTQIAFSLDTITEQRYPMFTDRLKLFQVLNNLITNALKYTKFGFVRFGYSSSTDTITFFVKDSGIGIPIEFRDKVFERFRKVDLNDRTDFEGTGLGLAITQELVKIMKGEIWFESEPGQGTSFFVRFPR